MDIQVQPDTVRIGAQNINTTSMVKDIYRIDEIIIHPGYRNSRTYDDIALLKLSSAVEAGLKIRPACLWQTRSFDESGYVLATGYGLTEFGGFHVFRFNVVKNQKLIIARWNIILRLAQGEPHIGRDHFVQHILQVGEEDAQRSA